MIFPRSVINLLSVATSSNHGSLFSVQYRQAFGADIVFLDLLAIILFAIIFIYTYQNGISSAISSDDIASVAAGCAFAGAGL